MRALLIAGLAAITVAAASPAGAARSSYPPVIPPLPALPHGPRTVVLTFDDGPDPTWTPRVLHQLALHHVHGVFCQIGREAERHPELVRAVLAGGNQLCDHTYSHPLDVGSLDTDAVVTELRLTLRAQQRATRATGQRLREAPAPHLFRIPYGHWTAQTNEAGRRLHLTALGWNVDPRDWSDPGASVILEREIAQLRPGGIVINHDGGGDRSQTVQSLSMFLDWLAEHHWTVVLPVRG